MRNIYVAEHGGYLSVSAGDEVEVLVPDPYPADFDDLLFPSYVFAQHLRNFSSGWVPVDVLWERFRDPHTGHLWLYHASSGDWRWEKMPPMPSRPCPMRDDEAATQFLESIYIRRRPTDDVCNLLKNHLRPLALDVRVIDEVFMLFGLTTRAMAMMSLCDQVGNRSFKYHFKEQSRIGLDVIRGRIVDYGNNEYRTFAFASCLRNLEARYWLGRMASLVPSLDPNYPDTDTSIDNTGDVVEVHFACLRGYFDDWFVDKTWPLRGQEYTAAALSFTSTMRLIQVLTATLRTGYLKYRQCHVNKCPIARSDTPGTPQVAAERHSSWTYCWRSLPHADGNVTHSQMEIPLCDWDYAPRTSH